MARLVRTWGPMVAVMVAIFVASSIPDLTTLPGGVSDHTGHFVAYALLGAAALWGFAGARWGTVTLRSAVFAWMIAAAYGVTDELHQHFVHGRTPAVDDWLADIAGAGLAIVVVAILARAPGHRGRAL